MSIVTDHLVEANLRGIDSHGIMRLPAIVNGLRKGTIKSPANLSIVRETPCSAYMDGGYGIGQVVSFRSMEISLEKALRTGIGVVSVKRSSHIGFLGYYTEKAARSRLVGLVFTNTEPAMAPHGGVEPVLGSNPISIGIPSRGDPIITDISTTVASRGKVVEARRRGESIPLGWALNKRGEPTADPAEALEGALLPIGGSKGYCLALGFEALTGALAGVDVGRDVRGTLWTDERSTKGDLFVSIDPEHFSGIETFMERVENLKRQIKGCKKREDVADVFLPGEREYLTRSRRLAEGIPVDEKLLAQLSDLCGRLPIS